MNLKMRVRTVKELKQVLKALPDSLELKTADELPVYIVVGQRIVYFTDKED